jgi:hypothetical protein
VAQSIISIPSISSIALPSLPESRLPSLPLIMHSAPPSPATPGQPPGTPTGGGGSSLPATGNPAPGSNARQGGLRGLPPLAEPKPTTPPPPPAPPVNIPDSGRRANPLMLSDVQERERLRNIHFPPPPIPPAPPDMGPQPPVNVIQPPSPWMWLGFGLKIAGTADLGKILLSNEAPTALAGGLVPAPQAVVDIATTVRLLGVGTFVFGPAAPVPLTAAYVIKSIILEAKADKGLPPDQSVLDIIAKAKALNRTVINPHDC